MSQSLEDRQQQEIAFLRERVRQLEELLQPAGYRAPIEWGLTTSEAAVFGYMLTRPMVSKQQVMDVLYCNRPGDQPEIKIVDVFVCKIRKKLKAFDVEIITFWGQGFGIADREKYLPAREDAAA